MVSKETYYSLERINYSFGSLIRQVCWRQLSTQSIGCFFVTLYSFKRLIGIFEIKNFVGFSLRSGDLMEEQKPRILSSAPVKVEDVGSVRSMQ